MSTRSRFLAALALILGLYTGLVLLYLFPRDAIRNLDFWYLISLGRGIRWAEPETAVNGLYPLGYPLLLHLATQAGVDALRFGQFLSWGGGLLLLTACFSLTYGLTRRLLFAIAGAILLLFNSHFLAYATYEGNDMLSAGLQASATAVLWFSARGEKPSSFSRQWLVLHALLLGLAYLTRYTALILLPISLIYLIVAQSRRPRALFQSLAVVLVTFLITTSGQLIPGWLVHQAPFYNEQAKNVWFGIYGQQDWVNNWGQAPDTISLLEVMAIDPARFWQHWGRQVWAAFTSLRLWPLPLHLAWLLAWPILALSRQLAPSHRLLLLMVLIIPLGITALAWLAPRFLLLSLWVEAVLIAWLAWRIRDRLPTNERRLTALVGGLLIVAGLLLQWQPVAEWLATPPATQATETNQFLRLAGMDEPARVATNDPYLHAVDEATRTRYAQMYFVDPQPETVEELLAHPDAAGWAYLVVDYEAGLGQYTHLRAAFRQAKRSLVPLSLSEQRDIYCLLPCTAGGVARLELAFDPGIRLRGYRHRVTEQAGALYLYWQAERELARSFKVSVRLINAAGKEIVQIDSVPQSWTFPTTAWPPETTIVDFYSWPLDSACKECRVAVLLYEEQTLRPLLATTAAGQRAGPLIELGAPSD